MFGLIAPIYHVILPKNVEERYFISIFNDTTPEEDIISVPFDKLKDE